MERFSADPADFAPPLLRMQEKPPAPLAGWVLRLLLALLVAILLWAIFGQLDIVAVADGKLVPSSYLKIIQPAEQGIVKEILVKEGQVVKEGEVLVRMDPVSADADMEAIQAEYYDKAIALRRIDAQLSGKPFLRDASEPMQLFAPVEAQYLANVRAYENALAQEKALLEKAKYDLAGAEATRAKLREVLPHYVEQEEAFEKLAQGGFAGHLMYTDKRRERIEKEQDLRAQQFAIGASQALIEQSQRKISQITADYRRQLETEHVEVAAEMAKVRQEFAKQRHRRELLELRAPQAGIVKDLATHTAGTVAAPGTILMTLVPQDDKLVAEVWVSNDDVGFVRAGQEAKLKLAAFQFQKYGLLRGKVLHVNADATEAPSPNTRSDALTGRDRPMGPLAFRTLVELGGQELVSGNEHFPLQPGMQVVSEIHLGTRSVLEYVLSPVRGAFHDAARER